MDLFEHQAKELFAEYGVPVPRGSLAGTPEEAREAAEALAAAGAPRVVVKAQVKTGGRGKAGGVKVADGRVVALDGKVTLDDNAAYRQDHARFADPSAADPLEARARAKHLNYVKLEGEVGIIGNGAGLVMSTLDVVALAGEAFGGSGRPTSSTSAVARRPR